MGYEEAALRGKLTHEQELEVVEAFAKLRDVSKVSVKLDLPIKLVRKALSKKAHRWYAKTLVAHAVGAEYYGEAADVALTIMKDPKAKTNDRLQAMKFLDKLLELPDPPKQKKAEEPEEKPESYSEAVARLADG